MSRRHRFAHAGSVAFRPSLGLAGAMLLVAGGAGCSCSGETQPQPAASSAPLSAQALDSASAAPVTQYTARTTSPSLEISNLDSQVNGAESQFAAKPDHILFRTRLVGVLIHRSRILGKTGDLARAFELGEKAVVTGEESSNHFFLRARSRAAVHHFKDALADLVIAEQKLAQGDPKAPILSLRASTLMAQGEYDEALPLIQSHAKAAPTTESLGDSAVLLGKMGKVREADAQFVQAELKFRSLSPAPLADLYFERARLSEREGSLDLASSLYKAANKRLPQHVHVAVHLAALVPPSEGIELLKPLTESSDDGDVFAQLGILQNAITPNSGDASIAKAKELYDEHYAKLPAAYADHAAWFWLNVSKDPAKAVEAAKKNLEERHTSEAYELAIAAGNAAHDQELLCRAKREGSALKYPSKLLVNALKELEGKIGCAADPPAVPSGSAAASSAPPASAKPSSSPPKASASARAPTLKP